MSITVIIYSILSMGVVALILGVGLVFASKKFAVHKDERIVQIENILPQSNCGACGVPGGCSGYAEAIVKQGLEITLCKPGGSDTIKAIAEILGMEAEGEAVRYDARSHCKSGNSTSKLKYDYNGILDCIQAATLFGGPKLCEYGCIGLGSCIRACPFDAIKINKDYKIDIIEDKCTACGKCVDICPVNIIHLIPFEKKLYIACSSNDKGGVVRKYCTVGCIGCFKCEKECPVDAIHVKDNLAIFDYDKCINCNKCFKVCPTGCIRTYKIANKPKKKVKAKPKKKAEDKKVEDKKVEKKNK